MHLFLRCNIYTIDILFRKKAMRFFVVICLIFEILVLQQLFLSILILVNYLFLLSLDLFLQNLVICRQIFIGTLLEVHCWLQFCCFIWVYYIWIVKIFRWVFLGSLASFWMVKSRVICNSIFFGLIHLVSEAGVIFDIIIVTRRRTFKNHLWDIFSLHIWRSGGTPREWF